ncbi:MAG: hypothetical protein LBU50_05445 [Cellulomonas sp.]|jgi:hypothetical protein|nr:hypothetical protein [Cellulomonas sp.]
MMVWQAAIAAGALTGGGLALIVRQAMGAPPDLGSAVARLAGTEAPVAVSGATFKSKVGRTVASRTAVPQQPGAATSADLVLAGVDPADHLGEKVLGLFVGLVGPAAAAAVLGLAGLAVPVVLVALVTVLMVVVGWVGPDLDVGRRAAAARATFTQAVSAYTELVQIGRLAGAGTSQAVEEAATVATSWPFARIAAALENARWSGRAPADALGELADTVGVPSLKDLARTIALSSTEDAEIADRLRGQARAMRGAQASAERATANKATVSMFIPLGATLWVIGAAALIPVLLTL